MCMKNVVAINGIIIVPFSIILSTLEILMTFYPRVNQVDVLFRNWIYKKRHKINVFFAKASTKLSVSNLGKLIVQSERLPTMKLPLGFRKSKFMFLLWRKCAKIMGNKISCNTRRKKP